MMQRFGDRAAFAVEVGEFAPPGSQLRTVDLWAGGTLLTTYDNVVFVPAFVRLVRTTAAKVRRGEVSPCPFPERSPAEIFRLLQADDESDFREQFWLMHWGETVDTVQSFGYLDAGDLVIVFGFYPAAHSFVARVAPDDFATTLEDGAAAVERP